MTKNTKIKIVKGNKKQTVDVPCSKTYGEG